MNLLLDPWIPVRAVGGIGAFQMVTYRELLCEPGKWQVSLPRDDLELACIQLLICMTQVIFLPEDDQALRVRNAALLTQNAFIAGVAPYLAWFDLDHPQYPFMQSREVRAAEDTPIQKLLIGLPEGNNHAFFNEVGEARALSAPVAAIALFNQSSNSPSFGGGFKGSLRGGAPITTLVNGNDLRETIWRNVLTRHRIQKRQIKVFKAGEDQPTWVNPIKEKETIHWNEIGLLRGLFWQPARLKLVRANIPTSCDLLGGRPVPVYVGFSKEKFNFTVEGLWPHPHGVMLLSTKKGVFEQRFASFTTTAPAWTHLSEFVVPSPLATDSSAGSVPAEAVTQASEVFHGESLHLMVGGYRTKQASVIERRHELMSLAQGWSDDKGRMQQLVDLGKDTKSMLRGKLYFAAQGSKDKGLKGIGAAIHETAEKLFYARTESLIHETFSNALTFKEWRSAKVAFAKQLADHCRAIFEELTDPYAMNRDLIAIIAWARRGLHADLDKLVEGT